LTNTRPVAPVEAVPPTDQVGFDSFEIEARHLPPNRSFTVFLLETATSPFGAAEYIGDFTTDRRGNAKNEFRLIVAEAFSSQIVNGARHRVDLNRIGVWFADPEDDFCLGPGGGAVTPFDGDNEAGVQAFNSRNADPLPAPQEPTAPSQSPLPSPQSSGALPRHGQTQRWPWREPLAATNGAHPVATTEVRLGTSYLTEQRLETLLLVDGVQFPPGRSRRLPCPSSQVPWGSRWALAAVQCESVRVGRRARGAAGHVWSVGSRTRGRDRWPIVRWRRSVRSCAA
jgi:hypothetical protein